jgi:hypothetical protein
LVRHRRNNSNKSENDTLAGVFIAKAAFTNIAKYYKSDSFMTIKSTSFGNRDPHELVRSGRRFVIVGALFLAFGVAVAAIPLIRLVLLALSGTTLVQYAGFMLEAQLMVHAIFSVILTVPAAFLIQQGRKRIRAGST